MICCTSDVNPPSGFRRNDGNRVDFQSTNSEPLGLEPRVVQRLPQATQLDYSIFQAACSQLTIHGIPN